MNIDEAFNYVIAKFNTHGGYDEISHTIADYSQRAEDAEARAAELEAKLSGAESVVTQLTKERDKYKQLYERVSQKNYTL